MLTIGAVDLLWHITFQSRPTAKQSREFPGKSGSGISFAMIWLVSYTACGGGGVQHISIVAIPLFATCLNFFLHYRYFPTTKPRIIIYRRELRTVIGQSCSEETGMFELTMGCSDLPRDILTS